MGSTDGLRAAAALALLLLPGETAPAGSVIVKSEAVRKTLSMR